VLAHLLWWKASKGGKNPFGNNLPSVGCGDNGMKHGFVGILSGAEHCCLARSRTVEEWRRKYVDFSLDRFGFDCRVHRQ
jgi:hypothetical protein